jgi:glycosyltransferase involved in cell wall biosynthesis
VSPDKCSVFINNVDPRLFTHPRRDRRDERFRIVFPGGLYWHQGLDLAVAAFARIASLLPGAEFHIYGSGPMEESLRRQVAEHGLEHRVLLNDQVPLSEVPRLMANADLGVVPKRADSFGDEAYSTKIMEFMSQGVPVIVARTTVDQFYFNSSVVRFFEPGNIQELSEAMLELATDQQGRRRLIEAGFHYAREHSWEHRQKDYLELVDGLISKNLGRRAA